MRSTYLVVPAMLVLLASNSEAQKSNTKGFLGNIHYNRTSLKGEDADKSDQGNGVGARLGWGFSPKFTTYLGFEASKLIVGDDNTGDSDYGLGQFELGLTYNFASSSRALVPYLEVSIASEAIAYSVLGSDVTQAGTGVNFGGGINYFFSRSAALQIGLNITSIDFDDAKVDGDKQPDSGGKASGGRLMIGFNWYPKG
jgi:hypothetical protein